MFTRDQALLPLTLVILPAFPCATWNAQDVTISTLTTASVIADCLTGTEGFLFYAANASVYVDTAVHNFGTRGVDSVGFVYYPCT